jgi:hypothetical protein
MLSPELGEQARSLAQSTRRDRDPLRINRVGLAPEPITLGLRRTCRCNALIDVMRQEPTLEAVDA